MLTQSKALYQYRLEYRFWLEAAPWIIELIGQLYQVGRDAQPLSIEEHQRLDHLDYSLKCWTALTPYLDDGRLPINNKRVGNLIRSWALWRSTGCLPARCAAASVPPPS